MRQFGWSDMIKAVAISAIVTSGLWGSAGLVWYYRSGPGAVQGSAASQQQSGTPGMPPAQAPVGALVPANVAPAPSIPLPETGALVIPVSGIRPAQLVDTFTQSRAGGRVHDAIDIMAPRGTPVVSAAAGTVEKLFRSDQGGNTVYVRSADRRLIYYYAHLDAYAPGLAEGQVLPAGAPVGTVGFSGNASPGAPHLHFAIMATTLDRAWYQPATAINPYPLLARAAG